MRALLALFALHAGVIAARAAPTRVVSTNVCTDQLLLRLGDRAKIAALSNLSQDATLSNMALEARGLPQTSARAEDIVRLRPDLVLANAWTGAAANRFLKGIGVKVLVVPEAKSFEDIAATLENLGRALGAEARAAAIVNDMWKRLSDVKRGEIAGSALIYEPNGYSPAKGTLSNQVLTLAGWRNLAPDLGVETYGAVPLERVVMTRIDLLVFDDHAPSVASRAQALLHHPALKTLSKTAEIEWMPSRLWLCAGPWSVEAVARLAKIEHRP